MIASSYLVSLVRKRLASPDGVAGRARGLRLRGRGAEGKMLRGRESVALPGRCGSKRFVHLGLRPVSFRREKRLFSAAYATTPPARVSRTHQRQHIICLTWLVLRVQACPGPGRTRTCKVSFVIGACCGVDASSPGRGWIGHEPTVQQNHAGLLHSDSAQSYQQNLSKRITTRAALICRLVYHGGGTCMTSSELGDTLPPL